MKAFQIVFLLSSLLVGGEICFSQSYSYGYDANGNRVTRFIPLKSTRADDFMQKNKSYSEKLGDLEINIFPNPTQGELTVSFKNFNSEASSSILIYDNSGKLLKSNINVQESNSFDFTELPVGLYILKITVGEYKSQWKIIKE